MSRISKDKLLHFFYGAIATFILSHIIGLYTIPIVALLAIGKEVYDKYNNGSVEWQDALFTCLPLLFLI